MNRSGNRVPRVFASRWRRVAAFGLTLGVVLTARSTPSAQPPAPAPEASLRTLVKSQHLRLPFPKEIQRLAVGDTEILTADLINSRQVLVLGRETGRTTLIVWFTDGTLRDFLFQVQRDLSVLQAALKRVHPSIDVESAPDRDALILTGRVPSVVVSETAEAVVRNYLDAGGTRRGAAARPFLSATPQPPAGAPPAAPPPAPGDVPQPPQPGAAPPPTPETSRLQGEVQPSGTVINLIQLETLPALPEEKIAAAIKSLGGGRVTIRRVQRGNVRDDARDTLVLEGTVANQIALLRILEVASQLFAGQTITEEDIRVVGDEAGALSNRADVLGQGAQTGFGNANIPGLNVGGGGGGGSQFTNQIRRNIGRAKAIEAARGRILSFIDVADLPQIRVDIRLIEVNRTKLLSFDPNSVLLLSSFSQPALNPARSATQVQGNQAPKVGANGSAVQNVLSFLAGGLINEFQFAGSRAAVDAAVALLERQGIARSLSSPSLTVLSGELAQFQVGGDIPIPIAFSPLIGGAGPANNNTNPFLTGVFNAVAFVSTGVQLRIRPLVGDDDSVTLDVEPRVVTPDATLTDTIRQTTGTNQLTTAFQTRALRTSSRLQDGQSLLIGGLLSQNTSNNLASTPGVRDIAGLGWLFRSFNRNDDSQELVVVVNPVILRQPATESALWSFPDRDELMRSVQRALPAAPAVPPGRRGASESPREKGGRPSHSSS